ncbi:MAG: peptidoglycan synthetase [Bacteroidia bacterium]|nr:peptidoglycan synthetase [Bacteroidia bacterium]
MKHIHFIAIGGAAMHNLALALHEKGYKVTGSDDEINDPSKSRLAAKDLLPEQIGWFPEKIEAGPDEVILGMHARKDNPELIKALELGIRVFSYPEYLYEQTKDKKRIVVGGSHGKTSITAMIMHCLRSNRVDFDYMVGSQVQGFDTMVSLNNTSRLAVFEGDEYLTSPIDLRPKFHLYKPHFAIISGIAWDHINVFPTFDNYVDQFRQFIHLIEPHGKLAFCQDDPVLAQLCQEDFSSIQVFPYSAHPHQIIDGKTYLITPEGAKVGLKIFGYHNLMNLEAARLACVDAGLTKEQFYNAIAGFTGAARRLEWMGGTETMDVYRDFAHSPSKLKATTDAVKAQFPYRTLVACMELHTFSSLNENFLNEYAGSMDLADIAVVYFNPHTIAHKKLKPITPAQVKEAFKRTDLQVFTDSQLLKDFLISKNYGHSNLLLMSSGTFDGIDIKQLASELKS